MSLNNLNPQRDRKKHGPRTKYVLRPPASLFDQINAPYHTVPTIQLKLISQRYAQKTINEQVDITNIDLIITHIARLFPHLYNKKNKLDFKVGNINKVRD